MMLFDRRSVCIIVRQNTSFGTDCRRLLLRISEHRLVSFLISGGSVSISLFEQSNNTNDLRESISSGNSDNLLRTTVMTLLGPVCTTIVCVCVHARAKDWRT